MNTPCTLSEEGIRQALAGPTRAIPRLQEIRPSFFGQPARPAAVLIPFAWVPDPEPCWHIVLTRRTDTVASHKGQVAFPGGAAEPGEDFPVGAALREAEEEIGLHPADVRLLGRMDGLHTISNFHVTPVVGVIPWPYEFSPQPGEVQRVFHIPLHWLADPAHREIKGRSIHFPMIAEPVNLRVIYFQPYDQEVLWGISAEITLRLLKILGLSTE